jgi:hypothetical protein
MNSADGQTLDRAKIETLPHDLLVDIVMQQDEWLSDADRHIRQRS